MEILVLVIQVICLYIHFDGGVASTYRNHEPDYNKIAYGGAIKHASLNPSEEYGGQDFLSMLETLRQHLLHRHPSAVLIENSVNCYTKLNLWYTQSDAIPLVFTSHVTGPGGEEYPVSIPLSIGSVYNCEVRITNQQSDLLLFVTLTKEFWEEPFYIYSHIYYPVSKSYEIAHVRTDMCEEMHVLSALSKGKSLYICISDVESELQERKRQVLSNLNLFASRPLSTSNHSAGSSITMKVMTYNIWNFNPYFETDMYQERLSNLLKLVTRADPDVICFQEVRFQNLQGGNKGPNQVDHLASALQDYQYVYQPAQVQGNTLNEGRAEEGLAIFSKHPIIYHDYLLLFRNKSNSADGHQRICLHATIVIREVGNFHIFNTHYSLSHEAREEASTQIIKFMTSYSGPAILMGDLNATPEEKAIKMLVNENFNIIDTWTLLHGTEPGFTFNTLEDDLSKRIDYILMRNTNEVKVKDVEVLPDKSGSQAASDHRALQAILSFNVK